MTGKSIWSRVASSRWMAGGISLLAFVVYLVQAVFYAHNQESLLDEGAYVYKGYLFVSGQYTPFQAYGPWSNQMPLSFLIPGVVQVWFGPGLRTARYFAIFLGLLMLAGLWILVRRLGGKWWAVFAVWAVALNPATIKTYSLAVSQGLVACMLVWTVVFVLGERRSIGQITFGAMLAGALLMTRINMAPVLPIVILLIFWQYGYRTGTLAALTGMIPVVFFHAIYWPGILQLWAGWIPQKFAPFLDAWRYADIGAGIWVNALPLKDRWWSFLLGIKINYLALVGLIGFGPLWLLANQWKSKFYQQAAAFLSVVTFTLVLLHAWASLGIDFCVYCFEGYLSFFAPLGLVLIPVVYRGWKGADKGWFNWVAGGLMIVVFTSLGYGSYQQTGPILLEFPFPRVKEGQFVGGFAPIWSILEGVLGIKSSISKVILPTLAGLFLSIALLLLFGLISRWGGYRGKPLKQKGLMVMTAMLIVGLVLSPTVVLAGANHDRDCPGDVIGSYERAGKYLASVIPPGRSVFWDGGLSVVPLLYLPGIKIYPALINDGYSYRNGGVTDNLARYGFWNTELKLRWIAEADYILIVNYHYGDEIDFWQDTLTADRYDELGQSPPYLPCANSYFRIFRRNEQ